MMKKIGTYAVAIGLTFSLLAPAAFAQNGGNADRGNANQGTVSQGGAAANLCTRIEAQVAKMVSNVSDNVQKVERNRVERESRIGDAWNKFDGERETNRNREDENLTARFSMLDGTAKNDGQSQAIKTFETSVRSALEAKRTAIDAALKAFHDGVQSLLDSRKATVSSSLATMQAAFKAAGDKVTADCAAGVAPKTVRTTFIAAVQAARKNYEAARKGQDDFSAQMKTLVSAKQAAFQKAQTDFKTAMNQARDALKAALGENSNATSTATSSNSQ